MRWRAMTKTRSHPGFFFGRKVPYNCTQDMSYKTLKQFILRSEVLKLYRSFLRLSYKVENIERRKELQQWIRFDFESNKNLIEEEVIKMMISRGKLSLREMEQTIMIAK